MVETTQRSLMTRLRGGVAALFTAQPAARVEPSFETPQQDAQQDVPATLTPALKDVLRKRLAGATMMGVRQAVGSHASAGLDPEGLAMLMREAEDGDPEVYLSLAEDMEEKDLHYRSVLGTRKLQVSQLDMTIEPASQEPRDVEIADDVRKVFVDSGVLDACVFDMLDAVGKGFSVSEIMWKLTGNDWTVKSIEWCDPRFFVFDRATRREPLRRGDNGERIELEPFKFIVCRIAGKSGIPIRGGLARAAAWAWMFKNFAIKDWVQFIEIYGIPFRVGKYAPGTPQPDIDELLRAVVSIAADAGGVIPSNMDIDFKETKGNADGGVFKSLAQYLDEQMSKAVLGQTGTTDAAGAKGLGSGTEHQQVREDIEKADAKQLMACLNIQAIRVYVDFKYGPQENYPWLWIGRPDAVSAQMMVDAAEKLADRMDIRADDIRAAVGFNKPGPNDELLKARAPAPPIGALPALPGVPANDLNVDPMPAIAAARTRAALLAAEIDDADPIARAAAAGDGKELEPLIAQLMHMAALSGSRREFLRRMYASKDGLDVTELRNHLGSVMFQALAGGVAGDTVK